MPCYGLAESTLMVTCARVGAGPQTVRASRTALRRNRIAPPEPGEATTLLTSCGAPVSETRVRIVDPETHRAVPDGHVGEIWVAGPSVSSSYWKRADESFGAALHEESVPFLRTGDLGALIDGDIFIIGRRKDLIIQNGANIHPADLEAAAFGDDVIIGGVAAVGAETEEGECVALFVEATREALKAGLDEAWFDALRARIAARCGVAIGAMIALAPGALPRTSSGKPKRRDTLRRYLEGALYGVRAVDGGAARLSSQRDHH
jgi:acyl-CoA synthetase (AMP-forming)/AMP-acid ligase II